MEQKRNETRLSIAYALIATLGATASITCGIAWGHWKQTLDQCVDGRNCSCILYGRHTPTIFLGGSTSACVWVTFGPLFYVLFAIAMGCFHSFRVLFASNHNVTRTVTSKNEVGETVEMRAVHRETTSPLPKVFWMIMSISTVIFTLYALIHFAIYLDGYWSTCKQYRVEVQKQFGIHGTAAPVIHSRLSCNAILDFMDYIQPDSGRSYREGYINTGLDLSIGIVASLFACILFAYSAFVNVKLVKKQEE